MIYTASADDLINENAIVDQFNAAIESIKKSLSGAFDFESAGREMERSMNSTERELQKAGVNTDRIKSIVKRNVEKSKPLAECFASSPSGEALNENFKDRIEEVANQSFFQTFRNVYAELKTATADELTTGLMILLAIFVVQTIALQVIVGILLAAGLPLAGATGVAMAILAIFVAPLTEEYGRRVALQSGVGVAGFTATINVFEFIGYTLRIVSAGGRLVAAVIMRTLAALMHHFVNTIQMRGYAKDTVAGKPNPGLNSFMIAVAVHATWNLLAVVFQVPIARLSGLKLEVSEGLDDELLLQHITL